MLNKVWFLGFHIHNWLPDTSEDGSELVGNLATDTPGAGVFHQSFISSYQGSLEVVPSLYAETQPQGFWWEVGLFQAKVWLSYCLWGTKKKFKQWTLHPSLSRFLQKSRAVLLEWEVAELKSITTTDRVLRARNRLELVCVTVPG